MLSAPNTSILDNGFNMWLVDKLGLLDILFTLNMQELK